MGASAEKNFKGVRDYNKVLRDVHERVGDLRFEVLMDSLPTVQRINAPRLDTTNIKEAERWR